MRLIKYKEINILLKHFLLEVQNILINQFVGMYIGGSLATDSFDFDTSDLDCYIITAGALSNNKVNKIKKMHQKIYSCKLKFAQKIEASYIPQNDLINFDPNYMRPYFNEGQCCRAHYGYNFLIELYLLRQKGILISGPDIKSLIREISTQQLKAAILKNLYDYWEINLNDLSKFKRSDYQVFAVLTMCRSLYSLKTGKITSKVQAAHWAIQNLDVQWSDLIQLAIIWKPNQEINRLEKTQKFVRYVLKIYRNY